MSLEKASIVWSAKQLKGMVLNGKINFDHIVQRSYVWERSRKSGLIESMILGYPIPPVFAKRLTGDSAKRGDNTYYIMDGKQRLSTVKEFLNDEFALSDLPPVKYYDDETDSYKTGHFYMPGTMSYKVYNKQIYNSFRIAFIEY